MSASKRTNCDYIEFFSELHESNFFLLNVFKNLLKFGQFDCILCVENRIYPVHKLVLASCSPFFSEFLFKFPNIVKLTLVFAHLKSSDVLQLLSFLYYGHAIISNHKKASIAKFKNLLDLLAINNFSFKESHDGRLILQSLHQTRFECPPNTITFDFNMYAVAAAGTAASKKEPHVVLSYDATFNLKSVLNNYSKNAGGKPTALIEGDENEDACFESCREEIVENTTDPCENENDDSEASDSERARDREHAYHTTNSNKPHRTHRRSPAESDGGDSGRRLLQHCNFDCDENMEPVGKDNFDIVDNEVIIETSNETSDDVMGDKQNANQYSSERVWKQCISYDRQQMKFDTTHSDTTGSNEANGDHWKQIIRYRNDAACIDHDSSKLNVDFDVNFKPIVIENNARTNFSIVKTGKCVKNNCYVTVLEQEEYEETGRESKREIVVKENLTYTATVIDSTNIKQEFTRSDGTVKREGYGSSPDRFGCFQRNNCEDAALGNTHVESNGKLVQHDVNSKRIEHPVGGPVNNSSPTDTSSVQTRNNIELLIEASNVLLDINVHTMRSTPAAPSNVHTMRNTPAAAPSLTNTHSGVQNENKTNDVTQTGSKTSCSRPKRKQTLYKRSCDSDDADFYEPARDRNRKAAAAAPYRKAVRRLDFNSFAYKRVKTESDANALSGNVGIQPLRSERHANARNEVGNHRASVTSSSSGPFECYRRASVSSTVRNDRDSSGDERKLANREEVEPMSEEDDDSEATLSVEDFATSAECYDDVAREGKCLIFIVHD
uniref:BTB domain-containing protein n=1 Tax=Cacopsylla melanoneura TaxID=428564 RepID=A0A8D9ANY0_9HEMI